MCGITGGVWIDPKLALDRAALERMTDMLRHRGPDEEGFYSSELRVEEPQGTIPGVALGFRRLSIIDLEGSHQPLSNEDGSVWIVFNGEIYNYRELRRRLEGAGHKFRTHGDTETLVHLYEDEGVDFLRHLNGMFALALWDNKRGRLILARDRLGKKPLVYRQEHDRLLFASELKSLLAAPGVPRELDPNALDEYLTYQYVPHPNTIFRGTRKLPPGHYAVFENRTFTVLPYWRPDFNHELDRPQADYVAELRSRLTSAVEMRMQAEVPLGAFLSGGVDSSIIVALMQQVAQQPVKTFSIGFPVKEYDESHHARAVAEYLGTEHHEFQVEPQALEILPKLVWHYDEPFADSSAIPTYYVSQLTRGHVTVALSGDGGDELFAGYARYRAVKLSSYLDRLPAPLRSVLAASLWQKLPASARQKGLVRRLKRFSEALAMAPQRRYAEWISIFGEARRAALYSDEFVEQLDNSDPLDFLYAAYARASERDPVTATTLADLVTYLPCDLMTKVDIASMAHSLECRQPFLDYRVVELAAGMPLRLKMPGWQGKKILRAAFGHLLPEAVFTRPKMGFGVPLDHWFRGQLRETLCEVLLDPSTLRRGYFRSAAIETLVQEHLTGTFDHAARLWALLFFELWHRQWLDAPTSPSPFPPA